MAAAALLTPGPTIEALAQISGENSQEVTNKNLIDRYNTYLAAQIPSRSVLPIRNTNTTFSYTTTLNSLKLWGGASYVENGSFSKLSPIFEWETDISYTASPTPFIYFKGPVQFPDNTLENQTRSYPYNSDNGRYELSIENNPKSPGRQYNGNLRESMDHFWPEDAGRTFSREVDEIMNICRTNHDPEIGVVTTDDIFPYHERANIYSKAEAQTEKKVKVADWEITKFFQHNLLSLASLNLLLHKDHIVTQMFYSNLTSYIHERRELFKNGQILKPEFIYIPYPLERASDSLFDSEINFDDLQVMFIHAAGNKQGNTWQSRSLPPHILCAGSISSNISTPFPNMNHTLVPQEIANGQYYLVPEHIPSLLMQAGLRYETNRGSIHLDPLMVPARTAGTSFAALFLTGMTATAASRVLRRGGTFNAHDIKNELDTTMMKLYEFEKDGRSYSANVPNFLKIQTYYAPHTVHLPQILQSNEASASAVVPHDTKEQAIDSEVVENISTALQYSSE